MVEKKQLRGHSLRDAFEDELKEFATSCANCHKSGVVGKNLHIVYSESDTPFGRTYSVWAICEPCQNKRTN